MKTTQTIAEVKQEISDALSCSSDDSSPSASAAASAVPPQKMRIYATDTKEGSSQQPLPNEATLADHEIANDAVLYVVFRKAGKEDVEDATADADDDCWEAIDIETGEME